MRVLLDECVPRGLRRSFEGALSICTKLAARASTRPQVNELLPWLADGDPDGLAQLLSGWEAETVKRLKLEKFREPTPFPIEVAA